MVKPTVVTVMALAVLVGVAAGQSRDETAQPSANSGVGKWTSLWDGKTLDGWVVEPASQASHFSIRNGVIQVQGSPQGGWLHTTRKYSDFTLRYEVRYISPDHTGNTGLILRSPEISLSGRNWPGRGFEVELRDMNDPAATLPWEGNILGLQPGAPLGKQVFDSEAAMRAYRPTAEWNRVEIIAHGNRIWTRLNGEWLANASNAAHPDGHLGFQAETGAAEFRNLQILEHDADTVTPDRFVKLFDAGKLNGLVVNDARYRGNFSVRDGMLRLNGSGGWLRTDKRYSNYVLRLEFRILAPDTDSGVFLRAPANRDDADGWPLDTAEAQLRHQATQLPTQAAGDGRWIGAILRRGGTYGPVTIDTAALVTAYRPIGEWQEAVIEVDGRNVTFRLNGQLIGEGGNVANPQGGFVGLQMGKGTVEFRRVEIKGYASE